MGLLRTKVCPLLSPPYAPVLCYIGFWIWHAEAAEVENVDRNKVQKRLPWPFRFQVVIVIYDTCCTLTSICSVQLRDGQPFHDLHPPSQLFERCCTVLASEVKALLIRDENKVISQELRALWDVVFLGSCFVGFAEFDDEAVLDTEDCVGGFVGVVFEVEGPMAYQHSEDSLQVTVKRACLMELSIGSRWTYVIRWS